MNLNLHFHMMAIDGVYAADDDGNPRFQALLAPEDQEIADWPCRWPNAFRNCSSIAAWAQTATLKNPILSLAINRGWRVCMPPLYLAKLHFGPNAQQRVTRMGDQIDPESMDAL